MACYYFSIGGLAVGFGVAWSSSPSVVSALDIHTGISESTERAAEIKTHKEKERERDRECH